MIYIPNLLNFSGNPKLKDASCVNPIYKTYILLALEELQDSY